LFLTEQKVLKLRQWGLCDQLEAGQIDFTMQKLATTNYSAFSVCISVTSSSSIRARRLEMISRALISVVRHNPIFRESLA
jgi:hypothetical protein